MAETVEQQLNRLREQVDSLEKRMDNHDELHKTLMTGLEKSFGRVDDTLNEILDVLKEQVRLQRDLADQMPGRSM